MTTKQYMTIVQDGMNERIRWAQDATYTPKCPYVEGTEEYAAWEDGFRLHGESIHQLRDIVFRVAEQRGVI